MNTRPTFLGLSPPSLPAAATIICLSFASLTICLFIGPSVSFAQGAQNSLLVINEESPESLEIGNHYRNLRNIPARNVVYLKGVHFSEGNNDELSVSRFYKATVFEPIVKAIDQRKLDVDTIIFSAGFPTRINCKAELNRFTKVTGTKYNVYYHAPTLSLTSCMYFGEGLFSKEPFLFDQDANDYASKTLDDSPAFSSSRTWNNGVAESPNAGRRHYICAILGVVRPGGSSVAEVKRQLTKSVSADGSRPAGIFYFADHKDPRSRTRSKQFPAAKEALEGLGFQVEVGKDTLPKKKTILGATLGSAKHDWPACKSKFAPGAICDNFTSYGGWWEKNQTHLTHFLNNGAALSVGTVYEPYTIPYKIPTAATHVHYGRGLTAGESVYRTVLNPFQLLVVGDPLCRPFVTLPEFKVAGITSQSVVEDDLKITGIAEPSDSKAGIKHFALYLDGMFQAHSKPNQPIRIAKSDLSPGYHELRMVAVDDSPQAVSATQVFEFFVWPKDRNADLRLALDDDTVSSKEKLKVYCRFAQGQKVELRQNGRIIGKFRSSNQPLTIEAGVLGKGISKIYATSGSGKDAMSGIPKEVTVK